MGQIVKRLKAKQKMELEAKVRNYPEQGNFRSLLYKDTCRACGRKLFGRGTKRKLSDAEGYVCYGEKKCLNPEIRAKLLELFGKEWGLK